MLISDWSSYVCPSVLQRVPPPLTRRRFPTIVLSEQLQAMSASSQYAFVMKSMTKSFPGAAKPVLNQINLQFYRGAKIGIVGPNGAGKSTLMKIMAGIDTD